MFTRFLYYEESLYFPVRLATPEPVSNCIRDFLLSGVSVALYMLCIVLQFINQRAFSPREVAE